MSEEKCQRPVAFIRLWPGTEPAYVCAEHGEDTGKLAKALGYPGGIALLPTTPENDPDARCACTPGRVQEIYIS